MFYAFEYGDIELIKYFVEEKSVDPLKAESGLIWTLFDRGIATGEMDIIRYLIDERSVAYDGNELLEGAVSNGYFEVIKYLIEEKEVDQNFSCKGDGWTPLFLAVEQSDLEVIEY
ncbi:MAG: hypothetical protein PG981_000874 [Wolbachia endosymbiont of Ctenocephalides orientis wCori]|nr:MAG: hypothetical protein PG981_000874 [Wolbachia endosymbiont of Ctenocephalides orientis wCori]